MKTRAVSAATGRFCVAGGKTTKKANRMSNTVPKRRNAYVDVHTVLATGKDIFFAFFSHSLSSVNLFLSLLCFLSEGKNEGTNIVRHRRQKNMW